MVDLTQKLTEVIGFALAQGLRLHCHPKLRRVAVTRASRLRQPICARKVA